MKIIGLGRCVIGHIVNTFREHYAGAIDAEHRYLLNYETCMRSQLSSGRFEAIRSTACMPKFSDQLFCLEGMEAAEICLIEIFPPAPLYRAVFGGEDTVFSCFEDFNDELEGMGFARYTKNISDYRKYYLRVIEELVGVILGLNPNMHIVLLNGELLDFSNGQSVGSQVLNTLMEDIRGSGMLRRGHVDLLDINAVLERLKASGTERMETAFPYLYIRSSGDLRALNVARDCKHATKAMRRHFFNALLEVVTPDTATLPTLESAHDRVAFAQADLSQIAGEYVRHMMGLDTDVLNEVLENPHELSRLAYYGLVTRDQTVGIALHRFMKSLTPTLSEGADLKKYFYHIRTVCAYENRMQTGTLLFALLQIGLKVLAITGEQKSEQDNFILLWLKNIYLAYATFQHMETGPIIEQLRLFGQTLSKKRYLCSYEEVRIIFRNTQALLNASRNAVESAATPHTSKRRVLFVPPNGQFKKQDFSIQRLGRLLKGLDGYELLLVHIPPPWEVAGVDLFDQVIEADDQEDLIRCVGEMTYDLLFHRAWMHGYGFAARLVDAFENVVVNIKDWNYAPRESYRELFGSDDDFDAIEKIFRNCDRVLSHFTEEQALLWAREYAVPAERFVFFPERCNTEAMMEKRIPAADPIRLVYAGRIPSTSLPEAYSPGKAHLRSIKKVTAQGLGVDFVVPEAEYEKMCLQTDLYADFWEEAKHNALFGIHKGKALGPEILQPYHYGFFELEVSGENWGLYRYAVTSKFAFYLEAGLPMLVNERFESMAGLVKEHGLGVVFGNDDLDRLQEKLHECRGHYGEYVQNVARFRDRFTYDKALIEKVFMGVSGG